MTDQSPTIWDSLRQLLPGAARAGTLLLLIAIIPACASFPKQAFDRNANPHIKTIAVLEVAPPREFQVVNLNGVGNHLGLIGTLVEQSEQDRKTAEFSRLVEKHRATFGYTMVEALTTKLEKARYGVVLLKGQRARRQDDDDSEVDYSTVRTDADAILDVAFSYAGYLAGGIQTDYRPALGMKARLVSTKNHVCLYSQAFSYGNTQVDEHTEHFPSGSKYAYGDFDDLLSHREEAVSELLMGVEVIAEVIAMHLN
jgi:hypothetical protein